MIAFRPLLGATVYVSLLIGAPSSDEVSDWLKGLHNADETARLSAAWDRTDFGPSTALPILRKAMSRETPFARRAIVALIGEMRAEPAISIPILIGALDDADEQVRSEAAASLIKFGPEVIGPAISAIRKSAEGSRTAKAAGGNSESTRVNRPAADYAVIVLKQMGRSAIGPAAMALKGATPSQAAYFLAALRHFTANYPSDVVKTLLAFDGARPWRTRLFADLGDVAAAQLRGLRSSADLTLRREADREIGLVYLKRLSNGSIFQDTPVAAEVVPSLQAIATDKTEAWNTRLSAIDSLQRLGKTQTIAGMLVTILADSGSAWPLRHSAAERLRELKYAAAAPAAVAALNDAALPWPVQSQAAQLLLAVGATKEAVPVLGQIFARTSSNSVLDAAAEALAAAGDPDDVLKAASASSNRFRRYYAASSGGSVGAKAATWLRPMLKTEKDPRVSRAVVISLRDLGPAAKDAAAELLQLWESDKTDDRWTAAEAYASVAPHDAAAAKNILRMLKELAAEWPDPRFREQYKAEILKFFEQCGGTDAFVTEAMSILAGMKAAETRPVTEHELANTIGEALLRIPCLTPAAIEQLVTALHHPRSEIRELAFANLRQRKQQVSYLLPTMIRWLEDDPDRSVRDYAAQLVAELDQNQDEVFSLVAKAYRAQRIDASVATQILSRFGARAASILAETVNKRPYTALSDSDKEAFRIVVSAGAFAEFLKWHQVDEHRSEPFAKMIGPTKEVIAGFNAALRVPELRQTALRFAQFSSSWASEAGKVLDDAAIQRGICSIMADAGASVELRLLATATLQSRSKLPECGAALLGISSSEAFPEVRRAYALESYIASGSPVDARVSNLLIGFLRQDAPEDVRNVASDALNAVPNPFPPSLFPAAEALIQTPRPAALPRWRRERLLSFVSDLARSGNAFAVEELKRWMTADGDVFVRAKAGEALASVAGERPAVITDLVQALGAETIATGGRLAAIERTTDQILESGTERDREAARAVLNAALASSDTAVRDRAVRYLGERPEIGVPDLAKVAQVFSEAGVSDPTRYAAGVTLIRAGATQASFFLGVLGKETAPTLARALAAQLLTWLPENGAFGEAWGSSLLSGEGGIRQASAQALLQSACERKACGPLLTKIVFDYASASFIAGRIGELGDLGPVEAERAEPIPRVWQDTADPLTLRMAGEDPRTRGERRKEYTAVRVPPTAPDLPLAPPPPSSWTELFTGDARSGLHTLRDVRQRLAGALARSGYTRTEMFRFGEAGFAVATQVERFNSSDLAPYEGEERWNNRQTLAPPHFLFRHIHELFFAPPGNYRMLTFVVTPLPTPQPDVRTFTTDEVRRLAEDSADPMSLDEKSFDDYHCYALVYEFTRRAGERARLATSGRSAKDHLSRIGL
jgi:HEAT repeat protein